LQEKEVDRSKLKFGGMPAVLVLFLTLALVETKEGYETKH
jgi:hypothetical protein